MPCCRGCFRRCGQHSIVVVVAAVVSVDMDGCDHNLGPFIVPVCANQKYQHCRGNRHYSGNQHYSVCSHYLLFSSVPSDATGTIEGNRRFSTGALEDFF